MGLLKKTARREPLEVQIAGESLFNDGVGVVVFMGLLEFAGEGGHFTSDAWRTSFFARRLAGPCSVLAIGGLVYRLLKAVDDYQVEILLSLALVAGGSALADALHLSGPIAMVVAGLLIGNHGRSFAMSETTEHLDQFWELVDEMLNAVLFVAIGIEVLVLTFTWRYLAAGLLAMAVVSWPA